MKTETYIKIDTEEMAFKISLMLCKSHKCRNRKAYPLPKDDPSLFVNRLCNKELDALMRSKHGAVNQLAVSHGFNRAFKLSKSY